VTSLLGGLEGFVVVALVAESIIAFVLAVFSVQGLGTRRPERLSDAWLIVFARQGAACRGLPLLRNFASLFFCSLTGRCAKAGSNRFPLSTPELLSTVNATDKRLSI
jgi:hypothetical protein